MKLTLEMVKARYLCFGEKQCTDLIQWDKEVVNIMEENFICKSGQSLITVAAGGLYRIEVGLFKDIKIDELVCYIVLNGEPICSFG